MGIYMDIYGYISIYIWIKIEMKPLYKYLLGLYSCVPHYFC